MHQTVLSRCHKRDKGREKEREWRKRKTKERKGQREKKRGRKEERGEDREKERGTVRGWVRSRQTGRSPACKCQMDVHAQLACVYMCIQTYINIFIVVIAGHFFLACWALVAKLAEPPHPRPPTLMKKLCIHECTCMPCGECVCKYVNWCQKHSYSVHTCTCTGAQDTCLVHATLTAENAYTPAQARLCDDAATSLTWKPVRTISKLDFCLRNYQNWHALMTRSRLRHHTGIIWSTMLVRAPIHSQWPALVVCHDATHHRGRFLFSPIFLA